MAVTPINNFESWYDSSRPFTFKFKTGATNAIGIVYVLQLRNEDTNAWETVTEHLKQPLQWGYSNECWVDPSQICTDYVRFNPTQGLGTDNKEYMKYHVTYWRIYATEQLLLSTGEVTYDNDINNWYMCGKWWAIDNSTTHEETYGKGEHEYPEDWHLNASNWTGTKTARMLSDMPKVMEVCYEDNHIMSWGTRLKNMNLECDIYREDGTIHTDVDISAAMGSPGVYQFGIGVPQIQYYLVNAGTINSYWSSSNDWTKLVWRWCSNGVKYSADYTFLLKNCGCTNEHIRIWWRSARNGMDCFTLQGTYSTKVTSSFERFQKPLGMRRVRTEDTRDSGFQQNNTFNQQSSGHSKVNVRANKRVTAFSHWVNKEQLDWLSQILTSTHVWIEDRSASTMNAFKLTPVIVTNGEIQTKPLNSSLGKIKLNLEYGNPRTTNRI